MNEGAELGGALRASFDLAAATTLDVAQAADLGVIALSTFGGELQTGAEKSDFINSALDNLVRAADASVAEVTDLGEALAFVGPTASQTGLSFEDTTNALALLSTAGITGSRAGTTLEATLRDLTKMTDKSFTQLNCFFTRTKYFNAEGLSSLPLNIPIPSLFRVSSKSVKGLIWYKIRLHISKTGLEEHIMILHLTFDH